jgi:hypothetical protein
MLCQFDVVIEKARSPYEKSGIWNDLENHFIPRLLCVSSELRSL